MVFAGDKLNINTVNTELSGVFISKPHCPLPESQTSDTFPRSQIVDKTKQKYPKVKLVQLPFLSRVTKEVAKKLVFMKQALSIALSKLPSFEVMESAYRLAVVKREERLDRPGGVFHQMSALARSRRGQLSGHFCSVFVLSTLVCPQKVL